MDPFEAERTSPPITLAAFDVILLAELLGDLDGFLRSPDHHDAIWAALRSYCARTAGCDAGHLVDAVSLFARHLGELIAHVDRGEAAYAAVADLIDEDCDERPPW